MADHGIIIDVGFQPNIGDFIDEIQKEFKKINFDEIVGLSDAFDKQKKDVEKQLIELSKNIDDAINGKIGEDPLKQIKDLQKAVNTLTDGFKTLVKVLPNNQASTLTNKLKDITGQAENVVKSLDDTIDTVNELSKTSENVSISPFNSKRINELKEAFRLLENIRKTSIDTFGTPQKRGHKVLDDEEEIIKQINADYNEYKKIANELSSIDTTNPDNVKIADELNIKVASLITNMSRYASALRDISGGDFNLFKNVNVDQFIDIIEKRLNKPLEYIRKRKAEIQTEFNSIGGEGSLEELLFQKSERKSDEPVRIYVALQNGAKEKIKKEIDEVINVVQGRIGDNPIEIGVKLVSSTQSKGNKQILEKIRSEIKNIDNNQITASLENLLDQANKNIDNAFLLNINVATTRAEKEIKEFVELAKEQLSEKVSFEPEPILSQDNIAKFQEQLDNVGFTLNVSSLNNLLSDLKEFLSIKDLKSTSFLSQGLTNIWVQLNNISNIIDTFSDKNIVIKSPVLEANIIDSIELTDEEKQDIINKIGDISNEIQDMLSVGQIDTWSNHFISKLKDIFNEIKILFGGKNNQLSDILEDLLYSDLLMEDNEGKDKLREHAGIIGTDNNFYGFGTNGEKRSTEYTSLIAKDLISKGITPKFGFHSHGFDNIFAPSVPFYDNKTGKLLGADLISFFEDLQIGIEKQITGTLSEINIFDSKGFYDSNKDVNFLDPKIQKNIADESEKIFNAINNGDLDSKYIKEFEKKYGKGRSPYDLGQYILREETPKILERALKGTGYKNNYSQFTQTMSYKDFREKNPLGLDESSINSIFNSSGMGNVLNVLNQITEKIHEIKTANSDGNLDNMFNLNIDVGQIDTLTNKLQELIDILTKIPELFQDAFMFGDFSGNIDKIIEREQKKIDDIDVEINNLRAELGNDYNNNSNSSINDKYSSSEKISKEEKKIEKELNKTIEDISTTEKEILKIKKERDEIWSFINQHKNDEDFDKSLYGSAKKKDSELNKLRIARQGLLDKKSNLEGNINPSEKNPMLVRVEKQKRIQEEHERNVAAAKELERRAQIEARIAELEAKREKHLENISKLEARRTPSMPNLVDEAQVSESQVIYEENEALEEQIVLEEKKKALWQELYEKIQTKKDSDIISQSPANKKNIIAFLEEYNRLAEEAEKTPDLAGFAQRMGLSDENLAILQKFYEKMTNISEITMPKLVDEAIPEVKKVSSSNENGLLSGDTAVPSPTESDIKKFKEYDETVAIGLDRFEKLQQLSDKGISIANIDEHTLKTLVQLPQNLFDKIISDNDAINEILSNPSIFGKWKDSKRVEAYGGIDNFNSNLSETSDRLKNLENNIDLASNKFILLEHADSWTHYGTVDSDGNRTDDGIYDESNKFTYKIYSTFEDLSNLTADTISRIMKALTDAGFQGQLKYGNEGQAFSMPTSTDQLVIHGGSIKDQKIAYEVLREQFGDLFSYIGGGFDEAAATGNTFSQTLARNTIPVIQQIINEAKKGLDALNGISQPNKSDISSNYSDDQVVFETDAIQSNEDFERRIAEEEKLISINERLAESQEEVNDAYKHQPSLIDENTSKAATETANAVNKEDESIKSVEKSAKKSAKAKKDFADANKKVASTAIATTKEVNGELYAMTELVEIGNLEQGSEQWNRVYEAAHEYGIELGEIASITKQVGTYTNKSGDRTLKTSYRINGTNGNSITLDPDMELMGAKEITDISKAYNDYEKALDRVFKAQKKIAQNKTDANNDLELVDAGKALADAEERVIFFEERGYTLTEKRLQLDNKRIANEETIAKIQEETNLKEYNKNRKKLDDLIPKANTFVGSDLYNNNNGFKDNLKQVLYEIENISEGDIDRVNQLYDGLTRLLNIDSKDAKTSLGIKLENQRKKISQILSSNTAMSSELEGGFLSVASRIDQMSSGEISYTRKDIEDIIKTISRLETVMIDTGQTGDSAFKKISNRLKDMNSKFIAQYLSWQDIIRYIRTISSTVIELDTALTELRKVSDASTQRLQQSFQKSAETAKELGRTITDVINVTSDWSRLGYSINESEELAKVTTLFQNVGDNMDAQSASSYMISTLQGFQLEADKAIEVADKFNEVANNFAIDTQGIGEALKRSAASFNAANTDLSESIALVTATNAVVQDPESVGTMWKTVSARIRGAKTELEDMGEDTEGMVESTSKLRDLIKGYTGFDIMKDEDTFKSIYDIIVGIGEKWEDLTDIQQAGLLEALAGKRAGNALAAALNNIDDLNAAYETAEKSAGSAQKEQENYEKSIQYSIDRLKATAQDLAQDFIKSDWIKTAVDGLNSLLELVDKLVEHTGSLVPILTTIAGIIVSIKATQGIGNVTEAIQKFNGKDNKTSILSRLFGIGSAKETSDELEEIVSDVIENTIDSLDFEDDMERALYEQAQRTIEFGEDGIFGNVEDAEELVKSYETINESTEKATSGIGKFFDKSQNGTSIVGKLATTLGMSSGALVGWGLAIAGVTYSIYKLATAEGEINKQAKESYDLYEKQTSSINDYQKKVKELRGIIDDSNSTIEEQTTAREELLEIQSEMVDQFGVEAGKVDLLRDRIDLLNESFDRLNTKEYQEFVNRLNDNSGFQGFWNKGANFFEGYDNNLKRIKDEMEGFDSSLSSGLSKNLAEQIQNDLNKENINVSITEQIDTNSGANLGIYDINIKDENLQSYYDALIDIQAKYSDKTDETSKKISKILSEEATDVKEKLDEISGAYNTYLEQKVIFPKYGENVTELQSAMNKLHEAQIAGDKEAIDEASKNLTEAYTKVYENGEIDEASKNWFEKLVSEYQGIIDRQNFVAKIKPEIVTDESKEFDSNMNALKSLGYSQSEVKNMLDIANSKDYTDKDLSSMFGEQEAGIIRYLQKFMDENPISIDFILDQGNISKLSKEIIDLLGESYYKLSDSEKELVNGFTEKQIKDEISYVKTTYKEALANLSEEGNVDLTIRPTIDSSEMQRQGWNVEDGEISTTFKSGEFVWQGDEENGEYVYVHYTPILPDGSVLTPEEMSSYLSNVLEGSQNILEADTKGLVLKVDTDLNISESEVKTFQNGGIASDGIQKIINKSNKWDEEVHKVEESYYTSAGAIKINEKALDNLIKKAKSLSSEVKEVTFSETLDSLSELEKQFDTVDAAFAELYNPDDGSVDLSSVKAIKDAFAEIEEFDVDSISDSLNSLLNSKSPEEAQSSVDKLISKYIEASGILDTVTESNKELIASQLRLMGVTNSEEIVQASLNEREELLAAEQEYLAETGDDVAESTYNELYQFINLQTTSEETKKYLAQLALEKLNVNDKKINTESDIQQLLNLANTAMASAEAIKTVEEAKAAISSKSITRQDWGQSVLNKINNGTYDWGFSDNKITLDDVTVPMAKYEGDKATKSAKDTSSKSASDTTETFDWIETKLQRVEEEISRLDKQVSATYKSWSSRNNAISGELDKVREKIALESQAYEKYMEKANSIGLDDNYKKLVINGGLRIDEISDEGTKQAINDFKQWYLKMPHRLVISDANLFNCWDTLKVTKLQRKDEIYLSVNAVKTEKISYMRVRLNPLLSFLMGNQQPSPE